MSERPALLGKKRWQEGWGNLVDAWRKPNRRREMLSGLAFLSPSLIFLIVFVIIPVVWAFRLSFTSWEARSTAQEFIGLSNYIKLL